MPPPKKPAPPADFEAEEELTEMGFPEGEDDLGDIDFSDLDNLADIPLDDAPGTGRHRLERDEFEDSQVGTDIKRRIQAQKAAPEVSQGSWRERAFVPRGVLAIDQILAGIESSLKVAAMHAAGKVDNVRGQLKVEIQPLLRQAVEQAGGDGFDAWISQITQPPGRKARDTFVIELIARMDRLNRAPDVRTLLAVGTELWKWMQAKLNQPTLPKLSLKALEQELEGRIDTDVILQILFSNDAELAARSQSIDASLEQLRAQLRAMAGANDGLMWNFSRLKVEKRVIEAEIKRRAPRG